MYDKDPRAKASTKGKAPTSWDLYRSMFKDGDFVVVIDENDDMHWGKIKSTEEHATLSWPGRPRAKPIPWTEIRFISHDGFPVKKLFGADGSRSIEKLDSKKPMQIIRTMLDHTFCDRCSKVKPERLMERGSYPPSCTACYRKIYVRFGDPFDIETVRAELVNSGNCGDAWWGEDFEEVLMLYADDGARAQLFDLSTVFQAEVMEAA